MYILVLIISLQSQFNHSLDVKFQDNIPSIETCMELGKKSTTDLQKFNKEVETKYFCQETKHKGI